MLLFLFRSASVNCNALFPKGSEEGNRCYIIPTPGCQHMNKYSIHYSLNVAASRSLRKCHLSCPCAERTWGMMFFCHSEYRITSFEYVYYSLLTDCSCFSFLQPLSIMTSSSRKDRWGNCYYVVPVPGCTHVNMYGVPLYHSDLSVIPYEHILCSLIDCCCF